MLHLALRERWKKEMDEADQEGSVCVWEEEGGGVM